jgi:hypothetical protein
VEAYVIEQDVAKSFYNKDGKCQRITGRGYYVQSKSKDVDPFDIRYAKVFPSIQSVRNGLTWAYGNPKVLKVKVSVDVLEEVEI